MMSPAPGPEPQRGKRLLLIRCSGCNQWITEVRLIDGRRWVVTRGTRYRDLTPDNSGRVHRPRFMPAVAHPMDSEGVGWSADCKCPRRIHVTRGWLVGLLRAGERRVTLRPDQKPPDMPALD